MLRTKSCAFGTTAAVADGSIEASPACIASAALGGRGNSPVSSRGEESAEHCRAQEDAEEEGDGNRSDAAAAGRLGGAGDAGYEQRDDQRDDRHLQRIEPQRADDRSDLDQRLAQAVAGLGRQCPADQADDQRHEHPPGARAADRLGCRDFGVDAHRGLPELEDEAVGTPADLFVEHQQAVVVGRIAQQRTFGLQHEARALEVGANHRRVDPVQLLDHGARVAAGVGDMVDNADHRARLHRRVKRLEPGVRLHARDLALRILPIDVVVIEIHDHEVVGVGADHRRLERRRNERGIAGLGGEGVELRLALVVHELGRLPDDQTAFRTDGGRDDFGPIAVGAEHIDDVGTALEPEEGEHLRRLAAFVELDVGFAPRARIGDRRRHVRRLGVSRHRAQGQCHRRRHRPENPHDLPPCFCRRLSARLMARASGLHLAFSGQRNSLPSLSLSRGTRAMATIAGAPSVKASAERRFYCWMAIGLVALVFLGFAPSFYLRDMVPAYPRPNPTLPPSVLIHGGLFTLWMLAFIVQTQLVAAGRRDVHMKLGIAWLVLAAAMVPMMYLIGVWQVARNNVPPFTTPLDWTSLPLFAIPAFVILVWQGWKRRKQAQWHKRLMLGAAMIVALGPAFGRLPLAPPTTAGFVAQMTASLLFFVPLFLWDRRSLGRTHSATWRSSGSTRSPR